MFHCNPSLPEKEGWRNFLDHMLTHSKQAQGVTNSREDEITTWIKEWFNLSSEIDTKDGMYRGFVSKNGMRYFQVAWLKKYILDQRLTNVDSSQLWSYLKGRGAVQRASVRVGGEVMKLWGLPENFFVEEEETDISFLDDE